MTQQRPVREASAIPLLQTSTAGTGWENGVIVGPSSSLDGIRASMEPRPVHFVWASRGGWRGLWPP